MLATKCWTSWKGGRRGGQDVPAGHRTLFFRVCLLDFLLLSLGLTLVAPMAGDAEPGPSMAASPVAASSTMTSDASDVLVEVLSPHADSPPAPMANNGLDSVIFATFCPPPHHCRRRHSRRRPRHHHHSFSPPSRSHLISLRVPPPLFCSSRSQLDQTDSSPESSLGRPPEELQGAYSSPESANKV